MTTRDLTSGMSTQVAAASLSPIIFFEAEFGASGSPDIQLLRLMSGLGTRSWNGYTWTGGGNLLTITPLKESARIEAVGFRVSISGLPSDKMSLALGSIRQGRYGKVWLGAIDSADAVVADPYLIAQGRLDTAVIERNGPDATIALVYESRLVDLKKPRLRYYTDEDQQRDYPGDLGFDRVADMQDKLILWGGPAAAASPIAAPQTVPPAPQYTPVGTAIRETD